MLSRASFACCLAFAVPILLAGNPAFATDYHVDRLTDSATGACTSSPDDCSLRRAILLANSYPGDDVVYLPAGTFVLSLPGQYEEGGLTGDLDVTDTVRIEGLGPERTIIDAGGIDRVFDVDASGGRLTLRGVTVTGGAAPLNSDYGGGIRAHVGDLRLESCVVTGNAASKGGGGAIESISAGVGERTEIIDSWITGNSSEGATLRTVRLWLEGSTVSDNVSTTNGSAVMVYGDSTLLDSTVSGHTTAGSAGGVMIVDGETTIEGCTLAGNVGSELSILDNATVEMSNTLIAGTCSGTVHPGTIGGNLESPANTCGLGASDAHDVADPGLSALGFFGGPTPVFQPQAGSAVVDAAIAGPNCGSLDQRRLARPRDGDGGGAGCDIGAVELAGQGEIFVETFECGFTTPWSSAVNE